jgi:hypothetical protein
MPRHWNWFQGSSRSCVSVTGMVGRYQTRPKWTQILSNSMLNSSSIGLEMERFVWKSGLAAPWWFGSDDNRRSVGRVWELHCAVPGRRARLEASRATNCAGGSVGMECRCAMTVTLLRRLSCRGPGLATCRVWKRRSTPSHPIAIMQVMSRRPNRLPAIPVSETSIHARPTSLPCAPTIALSSPPLRLMVAH